MFADGFDARRYAAWWNYLGAILRVEFEQPAGARLVFDDEFLAATGDLVVVCCVAGDALGWLFAQMGDHDALHVAMALADVDVWHTAISGPAATRDIAGLQSMTDIGLSTTSTIGELVTTNATTSSEPRPLLLAARG